MKRILSVMVCASTSFLFSMHSNPHSPRLQQPSPRKEGQPFDTSAFRDDRSRKISNPIGRVRSQSESGDTSPRFIMEENLSKETVAKLSKNNEK